MLVKCELKARKAQAKVEMYLGEHKGVRKNKLLTS
jgi:hypothetical protein